MIHSKTISQVPDSKLRKMLYVSIVNEGRLVAKGLALAIRTFQTGTIVVEWAFGRYPYQHVHVKTGDKIGVTSPYNLPVPDRVSVYEDGG